MPKKNPKHRIIGIGCAQHHDNAIGNGPNLLYRLPHDQTFFRTITQHQVGAKSIVLMGKDTSETIPEKFWPLSFRDTGIISGSYKNRTGMKLFQPNVFGAGDPHEALEWAKQHYQNIWIAGGGKIYSQLLHSCDELYMTEVFGNKEANVFFPNYESFIFKKKIYEGYHKDIKYRIAHYEYDA